MVFWEVHFIAMDLKQGKVILLVVKILTTLLVESMYNNTNYKTQIIDLFILLIL